MTEIVRTRAALRCVWCEGDPVKAAAMDCECHRARERARPLVPVRKRRWTPAERRVRLAELEVAEAARGRW